MFCNESPDLLEIRESVKRVATRELPKYQLEAHYNSVPTELLKTLAEIGLTGLAINEEHGGNLSGPAAIAAVMEELAAVDLGPAIFISVHSMVSGLIQKFGTSAQQKSYLPQMASGKCLGAYALTEPSAGSDAANLRTSYRTEGNHYIINGSKCYISSAGFAGVYAVFARLEGSRGADGIAAFIVPKDTPGLSISPAERKMGAELSPIASLTFDNMKLPESALLGKPGQGYKVALNGLAGGRINIGACAVGISRTAIRLAQAHLKEREQFGSKLIDFQGLQFILADMQMQYEAARLMVREAAQTLERDPSSAANRILPSMAKCFATDAAMKITTDAVQLLGGAGYIKDFQVERLMREAKMLQIVEGTNQIQRMVIVRELQK